MRDSLVVTAVVCVCLVVSSCTRQKVDAASAGTASIEVNGNEVTVGTVPVITRPMAQHLTVSSELVPFQEIDVYAKEAGYVKELNVDYGSHVNAGQVMAVLEIPELEAQLQQDKAQITAASDEITREEHEVNRVQAQRTVTKLQYDRLAGVAKTKPGLVAQQEVDDAQGKDLATQAQVEATEGALAAAKSQMAVTEAKLIHDQALYAYTKITAPFAGVVTQRFANLGALMQAGNSSTQATPLVRLSQENLYRLVIPVPENYVRYIRIGDPVTVTVPSLDRNFTGKVARFSVEVAASTRTMHTEVDVPNTGNLLMPGQYAEAVLTMNRRDNALAVPLQAIDHIGEETFVDVVSPDGKVETRKVVVGMQGTNYAEILSGVKAGEQVIVSDRGGLKAGQQVKAHPTQGITYEDSPDQ
jgi:RND family efflux transporter MFP subunit